MNSSKILVGAGLMAAAGLFIAPPAFAAPPGTAFSYQGVLEQGGSAVDSAVDVRFTLFDDAAAGSQVGSPVTVTVTPDEGVFSASVDFGAGAFATNQALWVQIEVSPAGLNTFDDLGRQALQAAPYSLNTRGINVDSVNNRLGFGTASPDRALHLRTTDGNGAFRIDRAGSNASIAFKAYDETDTGFTTPLSEWNIRADDDGRFRIAGENNPNAPAFTFSPSGYLYYDSFSTYGLAMSIGGDVRFELGLANGGGEWSLDAVQGDTVLRSSSGDSLHLQSGDGGAAMTITPNNRVGIGTAAPEQTLDVRGRMRLGDGTSNGQEINFVSVSGDWFLGTNNVAGGGATDNTHFYVYDGSTSQYALTVTKGSNRVGIGTLDPQARLDAIGVTRGLRGVAESTTGDARGVIGISDSTAGVGVYGLSTATTGGAVGTQGEAASNNGVGVFGTATSALGIARGGAFISSAKNGFGVYAQATSTDATGTNYGVWAASENAMGYDFYAGGPGMNYGSGSSIRWKENVTPIYGALDKLSRIRGVYFDWDEAHGGHGDVGMIAEEVGAVLPEIVQFEENGIDAVGMDYSKVSALLVEAVKELQSEKDAEIAELRARIAQLERIIDNANQSESGR